MASPKVMVPFVHVRADGARDRLAALLKELHGEPTYQAGDSDHQRWLLWAADWLLARWGAVGAGAPPAVSEAMIDAAAATYEREDDIRDGDGSFVQWVRRVSAAMLRAALAASAAPPPESGT